MTTTWRDLTDQLTPWQISDLENFERDGLQPEALLFMARDYATGNLTTLFSR